LSASPGAPGPHDFAVHVDAARRATQTASIASRPTIVTTRSPLLPRQDDVTIIIIFEKRNKNIFRKGAGLVGQISAWSVYSQNQQGRWGLPSASLLTAAREQKFQDRRFGPNTRLPP